MSKTKLPEPSKLWTPTADGFIICVDCDEEYERQDIVGDSHWSDPRCLDCYETHRYER